MKQRLLLVDGHSVAYRSHFAFIREPLRNSRGHNTSAVFGFANTLRKLLDEVKPTHCAVAFDSPGPTFRHERFTAYKLQRPPTPDELIEQLPDIKRLVAARGLASFEVPGVEADDIIGTLARRGSDQGFEVIIATSDKDLLQLVGSGVTVHDPWQGRSYGPEQVREKFGVGPEQVVDFLALTGDPVDNVPGVRGIGPKRALALLASHGTLDEALGQDAKLAVHRDEAEMSRDLVRIDTNVELAVEVEALAVRAVDEAALRELYEEMEFRKLAQELSPAGPALEVGPPDHALLSKAHRVAIARGQDGSWAAAVDARSAMRLDAEPSERLRELVADRRRLKIGCGLKGLAHHFEPSELSPPYFDVGIGAWLLDPNRRGYALPDVVEQVLGRSVAGDSPTEAAALAFELQEPIARQLDTAGVRTVFEDIEMPLVRVLARMERRGVRIEVEHFRQLEEEIGQEATALQGDIQAVAGIQFNVASPKQLGEVLFNRLGLARGRKTKTGYSTNSAVLQGLVDVHPIVQKVLRFRELTKLRGTYIVPLLEFAGPATHRIHTTFNQTGAATGRLSSSNPNLQSIPIRSELGHRIRAGFVAADGCTLVSADYSQIELRVLAHLSGDEALARAFERGDDIHVQTAATVFHLDRAAVEQEHRQLAKVVNYGLIYGMGDYGLASRMGMSLEEARAFLDSYMASFAGVAAWRERVIADAERTGVVRTISGRIRPVPALTSPNRNVAEASRRAAINAPVQGSAADIIKRAMIRVDDRLVGERIVPGMVLQIHDELLFEVAERDVERAQALVRDEMESAWELDVPLVADVGVGKSWDEAH